MPLFQRPVPPFFLEADTLSLATSSTGPAFGGQVILNGVIVTTPITVTNMRTAFNAVGGTPGTCQMGIYDSSGAGQLPVNLLQNTATFTAAVGVQTKALISNLPLSPGLYWLAFLDTSSLDTVYGTGGFNTGMMTTMLTSATGLTTLPASLGALTKSTVAVAFCGLILGGWA